MDNLADLSPGRHERRGRHEVVPTFAGFWPEFYGLRPSEEGMPTSWVWTFNNTVSMDDALDLLGYSREDLR